MANRKKLTEASVLTLPVHKTPYRVWDVGTEAARGLHILIQPSGTKTYRAQYIYPDGKSGAVKLGRVGQMTLEEARTKTRQVRRLADNGEDPRKDHPLRSGTFEAMVKLWTTQEQLGRKQARSAYATQSLMLASCKAWHHRPLATIRYHEIEELLFTKREYAPYSANRLHAHLNTFFRWAVRTQRLSVSPMREMPAPWNGAKPREREWFSGQKADEVIKALWRLADELGGDDGKFIKLLLITGKRKTAVLKMMWEHIDDTWFWTPPPGSKVKRNHAIPLSKLAQRVLGRRKKEGRVMLVREGKLKNTVRESIQLPDFFWHGVRHIVETKLGELKVPFHVRDMLLDHAPARGAGRGYDHGSYRDEMLEALEWWCTHISKLVRQR